MHINYSEFLTVYYSIEWVIRLVMIFVVPRNRKPSSATAWLVLIMVMPLIGLLAYWLLGSPKLSKARQASQTKMNMKISRIIESLRQDRAFKKYFAKPSKRLEPINNLNANLSLMPPLSKNKIELISNYEDSFKKIADDIDRAISFIHIEFFIINNDNKTSSLFDALERAIKRDVKVRVLFDALGSRKYPGYRKTLKKMSSIGVEWHKLLPLDRLGPGFNRPDLRNHRKIVVIDGKISYTGSQNIIRQNYHRKDDIYYQELMARIEGPIAMELNSIFATDWFSETKKFLRDEVESTKQFNFAAGSEVQVLPSGPAYRDDNNLKLFTSLIHAATKKIVITNPYFVPDDSLTIAITSAAQRGVEVIIINSEAMDQKLAGHAQRSYYEQFLLAGVKIYWYKWPVLIHTKTITVDDDIAVIGSSNLDIRSFQLNFEVSLLIHDSKVVDMLHSIERGYLKNSKPILLDDWQKRPLRSALLDNLARLTAVLQ